MPEQDFESARWIVTLALGLVAIGFERRTLHIPNALTLGALLPVVGLSALAGHGIDAL